MYNVKMQSIAASFRRDWEQGIEAVAGPGVSAGAVRALKAYAEIDVVETLATIADAGAQGPGRGVGVLSAWRTWHPEYVAAEIKRMLPELVQRWPTRAERRQREFQQRRRVRWADDAAGIVRFLDGGRRSRDVVKTGSTIRPKRFEALVRSLAKIGAVRDTGDALIATASAEYAREKMVALSPSI